MNAHDLGRMLLAGPDLPVKYDQLGHCFTDESDEEREASQIAGLAAVAEAKRRREQNIAQERQMLCAAAERRNTAQVQEPADF